MVHLFKPTSYSFGAALAVGATLAWKLVSFANALLIALYFGAGKTTDIYFYLIMIMGFGLTFLQRMNAAVIIPEAMAQDTQTPNGGRALLNGFLYFYIFAFFYAQRLFCSSQMLFHWQFPQISFLPSVARIFF